MNTVTAVIGHRWNSVEISTGDLLYSPVHGRVVSFAGMFAGVAGDYLAVIDAETGEILPEPVHKTQLRKVFS